jgi:RNA recognition motif-containing protein
MSTVVIDGLDNRTNSEIVQNFCQNYGRVLNCYMKSNQCIVTFADQRHAEEFLRASPHRIDSNGLVNVTWKITLDRNSSHYQRPTVNSHDNCRLTIRGTFEQLEEKNLIRYFSRYGHVRMCLANISQGFATITFDDRISCEHALKEARHFLNGRSLIVEPYSTIDEPPSNKRIKLSDPNQSTLSILTSQFAYEKEQLINEQTRLQTQIQERIQIYDYEKQQWNEYMTKQQQDFHQQIGHYQYLLKQSLDEITNKDKQIEQLKQENKDIEYEDSLRLKSTIILLCL